MDKILKLLVGPPASGKSTLAKHLENSDYVRISQDDQGKQRHLELFKEAIANDRNIVIDRMNFSKEQRERYLKPAKEAGYTTEISVFHVPREVCLERCLKRKDHPTITTPEHAGSAIGMFFKRYERVEDNEADVVERLGWAQDITTEYVEKSHKALVFDLDGTLFNIEHRRHYTDKTKGKPNWKKFFEEMVNDQAYPWAVEMIDAFSIAYENYQIYDLAFASGRPDSYREQTVEKIRHCITSFKWKHVFMRPRDDFRRDDIIKEIILEFELKTRWSEFLFVDDRQQVVDMYRKHGYTVLQCAKGDF